MVVISYAPFVSVCLVGQSIRTPIKILCDIGAAQSLILDRVFLFYSVVTVYYFRA